MAFDWKEYVEWARGAQGTGSGPPALEGILRSALSRTYYGSFCFARNYARDWLGFTPRNDGDDHGRLRHHFKAKRRRGIADRLDRLRQWRNACDYLDDLGFDPQTSLVAALQEADYIFASLVPPKAP
jgi:hypothetical protein